MTTSAVYTISQRLADVVQQCICIYKVTSDSIESDTVWLLWRIFADKYSLALCNCSAVNNNENWYDTFNKLLFVDPDTLHFTGRDKANPSWSVTLYLQRYNSSAHYSLKFTNKSDAKAQALQVSSVTNLESTLQKSGVKPVMIIGSLSTD